MAGPETGKGAFQVCPVLPTALCPTAQVAPEPLPLSSSAAVDVFL